MTAENAKVLTDYLIVKYSVGNSEIVYTDDEYIYSSNEVDEHEFLKSIYPKGTFKNDSLLILKETAISKDSSCYLCNVSTSTEKEIIRQFLFHASPNNVIDEANRLAIIISSSVVIEKGKKATPAYSLILLKQKEDTWVSYQTFRNLNLNDLYVSDVKFKIEAGKNMLLFIDSFDGKTIKTKYFDIENIGINKIVESKKVEKQVGNQNEINSDDMQPQNTTKCRAFKATFLFDKPDINSVKTYQFSKGEVVYVYTNSYKETPGKFVRCVFFAVKGKEHKGYILSSSLEWLQGG